MKRKNAWIFSCCWLTYCAAYLCRVNFSSALDQLSADLSVSVELLSGIGAIFFIVYAISQLINGFLGDRVQPKKFIIVALFGTTICNVGVSLSTTALPIYILWGINGYFQAMFWSTIIRILSQQTDSKTSASYSAAISTAMPAGYFISWSLLGRLLSASPSILFFIIPAIVSTIMMLVWIFFVPLKTGSDAISRKRTGIKNTLVLMKEEKLGTLVPICVLHGFLKESVSFWLPLLVYQWFGNQGAAGIALIACMPIANTASMFVARRILKTQKVSRHILLIFFGCIALSSAVLQLISWQTLIVLMMALISGFCYGNNTVLMSYIPMQYSSKNVVASLVGIFDFCSYAGASVSIYVLSKMLGARGFASLPLIWFIASAAACLLQFLFTKIVSKNQHAQSMENQCNAVAEK